MTTATVVQNRIRTTELSLDNTMLLFDRDGILVLQKQGDTIKSLGFIEPEIALAGLTSLVPFTSGILPKNCISYDRVVQGAVTYHLYVFELDPKIMSLKYKHADERTGEYVLKNYDLGLPYVQMYITLKEYAGTVATAQSSITCSKQPISGPNASIYFLPLNNIHASYEICWGKASMTGKQPNESIGDYARRLVTNFFASTFNTDLTPLFPRELNPENVSDATLRLYPGPALSLWEAQTKENPLFILGTSLRSYGGSYTTFGSIIQKHKINCV